GVVAQASVLLGHGQGEEPVLAEQLEVAAREEELVVRPLGVRAHLLLAQLDQRRAQLLLAVGVEPVRIPLVAEPPERLSGPHLLVGHQASNRTASKEEVLTTRSSQRSKSARPCSSISATRSSTARSIVSPPIV